MLNVFTFVAITPGTRAVYLIASAVLAVVFLVALTLLGNAGGGERSARRELPASAPNGIFLLFVYSLETIGVYLTMPGGPVTTLQGSTLLLLRTRDVAGSIATVLLTWSVLWVFVVKPWVVRRRMRHVVGGQHPSRYDSPGSELMLPGRGENGVPQHSTRHPDQTRH